VLRKDSTEHPRGFTVSLSIVGRERRREGPRRSSAKGVPLHQDDQCAKKDETRGGLGKVDRRSADAYKPPTVTRDNRAQRGGMPKTSQERKNE